ncbi:MAG: RecX family transcriptional regulator [candidate division WOR-3 bacterium]
MKALNYALKLLKFRSYSINGIKKKLKSKGFEENEIEEVVEKLKNYGYINELEDAINYVKIKCSKGWSRKKIQMGLMRKNYSKEIIKEALNYYDENVVIEKLRREISRKNLDRERAIKLLRSRGFEWELIKSILKI